MTKVFCDWCGDEAQEATGLYRLTLSKRGASKQAEDVLEREGTNIGDGDICGRCAADIRGLRAQAKAKR